MALGTRKSGMGGVSKGLREAVKLETSGPQWLSHKAQPKQTKRTSVSPIIPGLLYHK